MDKIKEIFNKYREIIMYVIVGGFTTLVSLASYYLLTFTVLDANNPVQLQIANIISWIFSVSFAYVTNRKYVFESKSEDIFSEGVKFFSARLSTLLIDMFFMAMLVTIFKMNDSIAKILVQFIILVVNYILSKFLVFKKADNSVNKKKKDKFLILFFLMFMLICCFFPYTGDDLAWGTQIGLDRLSNWFDNYNGRYAGNLLILALTRSRILRIIIESCAFALIVKYTNSIVNKDNKTNILIIILLLLLMPVTILRQSVAWASGFANYVPSILLILLIINDNIQLLSMKPVIKKSSVIKAICYFIISFVGSLFIENITLYNLALIIAFLIYEKIKIKKFSLSNITYFVGSLLGSILMFSNKAYLSVLNNSDGYRTVAHDNIIFSSIKTFVKTLSKYIFTDNIIVGIILCICLLLTIFKYKKNKKNISIKIKNILNMCTFLILLYLFNIVYINLPMNDSIFDGKLKLVFNCGVSLLFALALIVTIILCVTDKYKSKKILFYICSIIVFNAPLLVITPIGPRLFLTTYIFYILIIIELLDYLYKNKLSKYNGILRTLIILGFVYLGVIYYSIYIVDKVQTNYIDEVKDNATVIYLPLLPHQNYLHCANMTDDVFGNRYKLFHEIDRGTLVIYLKYDKWQEKAKNSHIKK